MKTRPEHEEGKPSEHAQQPKAGKQKALGALVGAVMKETGGKANPKVVNELLMKKLVGG